MFKEAEPAQASPSATAGNKYYEPTTAMINHWPDVLLSCGVDPESYGCGLEEGCFQGTHKINSPVSKGRVLEPGSNEEVRTGAHWESPAWGREEGEHPGA